MGQHHYRQPRIPNKLSVLAFNFAKEYLLSSGHSAWYILCSTFMCTIKMHERLEMKTLSQKLYRDNAVSDSKLSPDAQRCLSELAQDIGFSVETANACAQLGVLVLGHTVVYFSATDTSEDSAWTLVVQDIDPEARKTSLDAPTLERFMRINGSIACLQSAGFGLGPNKVLELVFHSKIMPRQVDMLTITLASSLLLWAQCTAEVSNITSSQGNQENSIQTPESLQSEIAKLTDLTTHEAAIISNSLLASGVDIASTVTGNLDIALSQKLLPFVTAQGISTASANEMVQSGRIRFQDASLTVLSDGIGEECIVVADLKHSPKGSDITYLQAALSISSVLMKASKASVAYWGNSSSIVLRCQWPLASAVLLADILDNLCKLSLTLNTTFTSPNLQSVH
jgi:hypothetical protein